jgi:hypothetical protein
MVHYQYRASHLGQNEAALAMLAKGMSPTALAFAREMAAEEEARVAAERAKRDEIFATCAAKKVRVPGLSRAQRETLDAMHPTGWTVAPWTSPDRPVDPNDRDVSEHDSPNTFGGGHYVVNGAHVVITRSGKWIGYYAWGGLQYRTNGARRPWNAIVTEASAGGCYGSHRTPPRAKIVRGWNV